MESSRSCPVPLPDLQAARCLVGNRPNTYPLPFLAACETFDDFIHHGPHGKGRFGHDVNHSTVALQLFCDDRTYGGDASSSEAGGELSEDPALLRYAP